MSVEPAVLHLVCGKIAAGKSTLCAELARRHRAVIIAEDDWLAALFADELASLQDYVRCSAKLRSAMAPHVATLLRAGIPVVLDFQANTRSGRAWMKGTADMARADCKLHFLDTSDEVCLERLRIRNKSGAHPFHVTEQRFHQITRHFEAPCSDEGFDTLFYGAGRTAGTLEGSE